MKITTINPHNEMVLGQYQEATAEEARAIVDKSHAAFQIWQKTELSLRSRYMNHLATLLLERKNELAKIITQEMGKPITQAVHEIEKCALVCQHYAQHAERYLQGRSIDTEYSKSYVAYQPIGVIFAIMPWNYPFWQVFRFAAPTLMAGNTAILKHAPNSSGASIAIAHLIREAGFPEDAFHSLIANNDVATSVIKNKLVKAVTLTGSEKAGSAVGAHAASEIKKVVLELGGCDPYIVLADADIELAATQCVQSRLNNCGQVCISAKRIIAVDKIKDTLIDAIKEKMDIYQKSDPMLPECMLGPIARADLREGVHQQVSQSISSGAQCLLGGKMDDGPGFYYPATLLANVKPGMTAYSEEIFGPVVSVISVKDSSEAISVANHSDYGLSAGIFTEDIELGEKIARDDLVAGVCCVNTFAASDPRLPFGGTKKSGYGRELSSEGIREFCNVKTVCIK